MIDKITFNRIELKKKMRLIYNANTDLELTSKVEELKNIKTENELSKKFPLLYVRFLKGKSLGMFDCQSNININDICIDFDLSNITDEVTKFYASLVITTWITEKYMRRSNFSYVSYRISP